MTTPRPPYAPFGLPPSAVGTGSDWQSVAYPEATVAISPGKELTVIDLGWLAFLAQPWFVIPFYAIGVVGALWVTYDAYHDNMALKTAMKWA